MLIIFTFLILHWYLSLFGQTFFLHRYGAHKMFTMTTFWEKFFYIYTWVMQGSSYLNPRAYAILHRMHHAYSDTKKDPHSPHFFREVFTMMWHTKKIYYGLLSGEFKPEEKFDKNYPRWDSVDRIADSWLVRLSFAALYILFYVAFAAREVCGVTLQEVLDGNYEKLSARYKDKKFTIEEFMAKEAAKNESQSR